MQNQKIVTEQYGSDSLQTRIESALKSAGLEGRVQWLDLTPLDQFHVRGLAASKELADALNPASGSSLLDVGSGLGGPARFLAATHGCRVTGIDLNQPFVEAATMLTKRSGLESLATFQQGDGLDLPFADESFDYAWTQHVAMNIADRKGLYRSIHRVLKPRGRLAVYDIVAGDGRPLIFPVPWARRPEMSFLLTSDQMRKAMRECGFDEVVWDDKTEVSLNWFAEFQSRLKAPSSPLGLNVVMGPGFIEAAENLGRNLQEGRVKIVQTIVLRR